MPLKPPSQPPKDSAEWSRWAREVPVSPDPNSVGADELKSNSITEPKYFDGSVSTRALANDSVTDDKLRNSNALSVIGRPQNSNGSPVDIAAASNGTYLRRKADVLEFAAIDDADIPASIARDTEVTAASAAAQAAAEATAAAALAAHTAAADPHPGYLTPAEGNAAYQPLAAVLSMLHSGAGSPETVLTAPIGHVYLRTDGGAGTTLYVKESGVGNTGWVGK